MTGKAERNNGLVNPLPSQGDNTNMIKSLHQRFERDEKGFTLIELMVVVLIIAILIAIAIPTFLGARTRAQHRAAESNLRNALTAEKTAYTDNQSYPANAAVQSIEPSLSFVAATPTSGGNQVEATQEGTNNIAVCLLAVAADGQNYAIEDVSVNTSGGAAAGTYYASGTTAPTCFNPTTTPVPATWYTTTAGASW